MATSLNDLRRQLVDLFENFNRLGARLSETVRGLLDEGAPPDERLTEQIIAARREFARLKDAALAAAREAFGAVDEQEAVGSLRALQALLERVEQQLAEVRRRQGEALALLEAVSRLAYRGRGELPELDTCRSRAMAGREAIQGEVAAAQLREIDEWLQPENPFGALLQLVQSKGDLDGETALTLSTIVEGSFGKRLSIEALLGRIEIGTEAPPAAPLPAREEPPAHESGMTAEGAAAAVARSRTEDLPTLPDAQFSIEEILGPATEPLEPPFGLTMEEESEEGEEEEIEEAEAADAPGEALPTLPTPTTSLASPSGDQRSTGRLMAQALSQGDPLHSPDSLRALMWQMLAENRLSIAWHLGRALEAVAPTQPGRPPAGLLRALTLARHVRYDLGEIAAELRARLREIETETLSAAAGADEENLATALLGLTATLRPALFAPSTQAEEWLSRIELPESLRTVDLYRRAVLEFAQHRLPLPTLLILENRGEEGTAPLAPELEKLSRQTGAWLDQAPRIEMKNGMVKRVWLNWIGQGGRIGALLRPVRENDRSRLTEVRHGIERLCSGREIEAAVRQTNDELRGEGRHLLPDGPLETIINHARIGISFAQRWVALQDSASLRPYDHSLERGGRLKEALSQLHDRAIEELQALCARSDSLFLTGALAVCERALGEIDRMLTGAEGFFVCGEAAVKEILHTELLQIPNIPMTLHWEPDSAPDSVLIQGLIELIAEGRSGWKRAFELRKERGDLQALDRIIDILSRHPNSAIDIGELTADRNQLARRFQQTLQEEAEGLRSRLETAVTRNQLTEAERRDLLDRIEQVEQALPKATRFAAPAATLQAIGREMETRFAAGRSEIAMPSFSDTEPLPPLDRLTTENGAYRNGAGAAVAATNGTSPIEAPAEFAAAPAAAEEIDYLRIFFPEGLSQAIEALRENDLAAAACRLLDESALPESLQPALAAWEEARRTGRPSNEGLREIFRFLGFRHDGKSDDQVTRHTGLRGDYLLTLRTNEPGSSAPVAHYDLTASRPVRLLCLSEGESPAEMTSLIKRAAAEQPTIVFYFGPLNESRRRELAQRTAEAEASFLVLDDALLLHLCKLGTARAHAFLHCALPFSFLNPFMPDRPATGRLFHGRREEMQRLLNLRDACFVYGGRQAGKTSLLLEAQRRFARRGETGEPEQIAVYLDLRAESIGVDHSLDELFLRLCDRFGEAAGYDADVRQGNGLFFLFELLRRWLDGAPARRALFLLDEADAFLRADGNAGFGRLARFRELMEETACQDRFKVVLAGNQDVLRAAHTDSNPLTQYGRPIRLGSLLNNPDAAAASELFEKTLASIGYDVESPDLAGSLLSHSDYLPSQIQTYGEELVRRAAHHSGGASIPPRLIPADVVQNLLADADLRARANAPILQTLDLDSRYLVLARIVAMHGDAGPLDLPFLRRQALIWQPEGFREASALYDLRVLLDEMTALDVLRATPGGEDANPRYALRSPGLRALFGSREDLEAALVESHKLPTPPEFTAPFARFAYGSSNSPRRGPLTMRQLNELRRGETGVSMIFGCQATDLDHLHLFLAHRLERGFVCVNRYATREDFAATLSDLRLKPQGASQFVLVPADCAWDELWISDALKGIAALAGKDRVARVAFAADPEKTWQWLNLPEERKRELGLERLAPPLPLMPWHDSALRKWLEENGLDASEDERPAIADVTGNWPVALEKFQRAFASEPLKWRSHLEALRFTIGEHRAEIARAFGLDLPEPGRVLRELARRERATAEALTDATELPRAVVDRCLAWADLLGMVTPYASPRNDAIEWRLASLIGRLHE